MTALKKKRAELITLHVTFSELWARMVNKATEREVDELIEFETALVEKMKAFIRRGSVH